MKNYIIVDVADIVSADTEFINLAEVDKVPVHWNRFSGLPENVVERFITRPRISRYRAAYNAARASRSADALISHLPRMTAAVSDFGRLAGKKIPHLAFSFNFTSLPGKAQRVRMKEAFSRVDQFCVYTKFEATLYSAAFGLDPARFKQVSWTQRKPLVATGTIPQFATPYVAAIGGEARDFETLIATALRLPAVHFVVIARPTAILANPPANMTILFNLPGPVCWQIASGADAVLVPLIGSETCCGHVTLVSARLLALPIITTASSGTHEYTEGFKGTSVVPHADPDAFAGAILALRQDPSTTKIRVLEDQQSAELLYSRDIWRDYVTNFLKQF